MLIVLEGHLKVNGNAVTVQGGTSTRLTMQQIANYEAPDRNISQFIFHNFYIYCSLSPTPPPLPEVGYI